MLTLLHRTARHYRPLALLAILLATVAPPDPVPVTLRVTVVPPLQPGQVVHLSGSHPDLGPWKPDSRPLQPDGPNRWTTTLHLPPGTPLEFKFTLGTWATVERTPAGADIPNRTLTVPTEPATLNLTVARFASDTPRPSTVTGTLRLHPDFRSDALGNARTLRVWLPPGYDDHPETRYPVIYFHDGQNLFDAATSAFGHEWQLDEALTALIDARKARPAILVGIDNTPDRIAEYTADPMPLGGGKANAYARFVVNEVKPFIDRNYRTLPDRPHTATAGSSLGGLISLYLLRVHGDTFSAAAVVSPALWWADEAELKRWSPPFDAVPHPPARLWLDMGTAEGPPGQWGRHLDATRRLHAALTQLPGVQIAYEEAHGAAHNDSAWADRAPRILQFLLTPEPLP